MGQDIKMSLMNSTPYNAAITREQFLFYEMRTTARLICSGKPKDEVINDIVKNNLFQYPTEKSLKTIAVACVHRLDTLENHELIKAIVDQPSDVAKQICLYAMMKQYRLVWDFMVTVIGRKYQNFDLSFGKIDLNIFFMRLQEQDDIVASWSYTSIQKLKQILTKILLENYYIDNAKSDNLNPVLISPVLENAIKSENKLEALPAFNCLS